MPSGYDPKKLLELNTVRIPWRHLSPAIQEVIGHPPITPSATKGGIRPMRWHRTQSYGLAAGSLLFTLSRIPLGGIPIEAFYAAAPAMVAGGKTMGWLVRRAHRRLHHTMNTYGILQAKYEERYPKKWLNPYVVAKTHPACYVARNGDLVFRKPTRMEYYRYLWQKKLPGKAGMHTWRWRVFLKPPEVPEPAREWARAKLRKALAGARRPVPAPMPGILHSKRKPKRAHVRA